MHSIVDFPDVKLIINYEMPGGIVDYINRVGRTGRGTNTGRAISFITEQSNLAATGDLKNLLLRCGQEIPKSLENYSKIYQSRRDKGIYKIQYSSLQYLSCGDRKITRARLRTFNGFYILFHEFLFQSHFNLINSFKNFFCLKSFCSIRQ